MKCPYCGYLESRVVDSRPTDEGVSIRRRRECVNCQKRFTTYENIETLPMIVIKRDGSVQSFDRNKLMHSLVRACDKRRVGLDKLEDIVQSIEQTLQGALERQISSEFIGDLVMEHLRDLDEVAYVRFASVYRQFTDVATFMTEVQTLLEKRRGTALKSGASVLPPAHIDPV